MIQVTDLRKYYTVGVEEIRALDGVSITIGDNEYVAIMGSSGSGKSTLMNILGCLDTATAGTYHLGGKDVTRLSAAKLAQVRNKHIGFVFQAFELLPRQTALQNVELPLIYAQQTRGARRAKARNVLQRVGLGDRMTHRPNQISGGQKQRVAIARALINDPHILLADEPTGNLDSRTSEEILALFDKLHADGQTIVMVTHEEEVAEHAERVIRMRDGKVVSDERNEVRRRSRVHDAEPPTVEQQEVTA